MIRKDAFVASIDLKDGFYSVPVASHHQKYLNFFANAILSLTCQMGMVLPWQSITKITKVPFSVLRMQGHTSVVYVDNSYIQGGSYESCLKNVNDTIIVLRSLGFTIHTKKSVLKPTQNLIYLGFIINSKDMTLKLTEENKQKIYDLCTKYSEKSKPTIRLVEQIIGNILVSLPAVLLEPLFYRALETGKIVGLKRHRQNYEAETELSNKACSEPVWWKHNIKNSFQNLAIPKTDITIFTDASQTGRGITDGHSPSGGQWEEHERMHINLLELKATKLNSIYRNLHVLILLSLELTYQENTISKQKSVLENLKIMQNGNLIIRYLLKLLVCLTIQKLIHLLPE